MEIFKCLCSSLLANSIFFLAVVAIDPYSEALLSLKSELDDHNSLNDWSVPSGRNPTGKVYACSWSGVKCNKNSSIVTALDLSMKNLAGVMSGKQFKVFTELIDLNLSHNSLSGQFPVEVFNLTKLTSLDISRNNFAGRFPGGISGLRNLVVLDAFSNSFSGPLPVEVSQLQYLKVLNLAGSYFKGPIPPEYGSFNSLEFLHLAGNFLSGNIPPELGNLKTVTHMEIGYNFYQGSLPWQLGNMSVLQYLDIAGANLSGSIPKELSNLTKLQSLFLFRNKLTGSIPWEFGKIIPLTDLDLSDNQISGSIPKSFAELKNLKLLSLMYNAMGGTVPEGLAELSSLETLLIWNNFFFGSLPQSLGRNSKLKWVDVSTNNFSGSIPPAICVRGVLFKLILFSNKFTGSLSPSLSNCSSLVRLRLEDNSFSGEIPLRFGHLPDISYIDLSRNKFKGGIPSDIYQATNLEYFNVSYNPELRGTVPAKVWSLPFLQNFSASSCSISGTLPLFKHCKLISVIELDGNNLSGIVPVSVANCQALERMDLSHNDLSGHIPEELASLPALGYVDLSHNKFNGQIPAQFGSSSSLVLLNVSFNHISGSIPREKLFKLMGSSAFSGNPELCGTPLQRCPNSIAILGSKGRQKIIHVLLLSAGMLLFLTASIFGIFYFRRGIRNQWRMVSFAGLPQFTVNDVLRSFSSSTEDVPALSPSVRKAVLPTGITVSVKTIEWEVKRVKVISEFITRLGNTRHKNLTRLLGFCYNKHLAHLLYDYLPNGNLTEKIKMKRDWAAKYKIMVGIARGLCFLHHDCYPAIPHGNLKSTNILFDENMEPHLDDFGLKQMIQLNKSSVPATTSRWETGDFHETLNEELYMDVYNFGEIILEILTDGRLTNAGESIHNIPREVLLRDIYHENEVSSACALQEEIKLVLGVALHCTRSRPSDRPSMGEALKLLTGLNPQENSRTSKAGWK
ncbi:Leucine-rich repeat receptor-like protein kinase [Quillaja saponaria]|uniref:Leucine-rich repeat receptor-like protein kinase n=1 Tax=Quillaja saponaria TaxID=32244 RepID=A0AAD7QDQ9_QUISA|nr:Leucine-rich repeat receptor-like protein kinase [Quillaja saponaria]